MPWYAKLFCAHFVFNSEGVRFKSKLQSVLLITEYMLLKRLKMCAGAWPYLLCKS